MNTDFQDLLFGSMVHFVRDTAWGGEARMRKSLGTRGKGTQDLTVPEDLPLPFKSFQRDRADSSE